MQRNDNSVIFLTLSELAWFVIIGLLATLGGPRIDGDDDPIPPPQPTSTVTPTPSASPTSRPAPSESGEMRVRRELLGLRSEMRRVVMLVDRSGSMNERDSRLAAGESRWKEVTAVIATWLEHLEFEHCALVVFSDPDKIEQYPGRGQFLNVTGAEGTLNRRLLVDFLAEIQPEGDTWTTDALGYVYENFPGVDTVVLFSDGKPDRGRGRRAARRGTDYDEPYADEAKRLVREMQDVHPIRLHTVGLGNYFEKDLGRFLKDLAELTGGTFVGR